jgi:hypothetical protein
MSHVEIASAVDALRATLKVSGVAPQIFSAFPSTVSPGPAVASSCLEPEETVDFPSCQEAHIVQINLSPSQGDLYKP